MSCKLLVILNLTVGRCLFTGVCPWVLLSKQIKGTLDALMMTMCLTKKPDLPKSVYLEVHRRLKRYYTTVEAFHTWIALAVSVYFPSTCLLEAR